MAEAVCPSEKELGPDFVDDRRSRRPIAVGPLPCLIKTEAPVWKHFRRSLADAGAEQAGGVNVVIAHIEPATLIADRDQTAKLDVAALISCPHASTVLTVMKTRFDIASAIRAIGGTDE